jgi:hypothetical protein
MTITLELSDEQQRRLEQAARSRGLSVSEYAARLLDERLAEAQHRREEAIAMLQSWRKEGDPEEERQAYEELTKALDEDRPSCRKLFPPELKGITW